MGGPGNIFDGNGVSVKAGCARREQQLLEECYTFGAISVRAVVVLIVLAGSYLSLVRLVLLLADAARLEWALSLVGLSSGQRLVGLWACLALLFILFKARRVLPSASGPSSLGPGELRFRKDAVLRGDLLLRRTAGFTAAKPSAIAGAGSDCSAGGRKHKTAMGRQLQQQQTAKRLTVVLDLDYTLLVCYAADSTPVEVRSAVDTGRLLAVSKLSSYNGKLVPVQVVHRPWVREFLEKLSTFAELVVFTAGAESYAGPLVESLDPMGRLFSVVLYRDSTVTTRYQENVKDLSLLGRDPSRTVLLDDRPFSGLLQPFNLLPCAPFVGDPSDCRLRSEVLPCLQHLAEVQDVRPVLKESFKVDEYFVEYGVPRRFVEACAANSGCTCSLQLKKKRGSCSA